MKAMDGRQSGGHGVRGDGNNGAASRHRHINNIARHQRHGLFSGMKKAEKRKKYLNGGSGRHRQ